MLSWTARSCIATDDAEIGGHQAPILKVHILERVFGAKAGGEVRCPQLA